MWRAALRGWALLLLLTACSSAEQRVLFRGQSPQGLGLVVVVRERGTRYLRFGSPTAEDQSAFDPRRPLHEPLGYLRVALTGLAYPPHPSRLLMIGLGGGSFVRHAHALLPGLRLEAVEINPLVLQVSRRYFALPDAVRVHLQDGRRFVQRSTARYDVIFVDAYDAVDYPRHLGTLEFFRELRQHLAPSGVVVANLSPNTDAMGDRLMVTFRAVFPGGPCLRSPAGNALLMGQRPPRAGLIALQRRLRQLERRSAGRYGLVRAAAASCTAMPAAGSVPLLRDP